MPKVINAGVAIVALALLSSCASEPADPAPTSTVTQEASPKPTTKPVTPEPPETPQAHQTVIPSCDELVPIEVMRERFGPAMVQFPEGENFPEHFYRDLGPAATKAFDQAVQSRLCQWGRPNTDFLLDIVAAELPDDAQAEFVSKLRASAFTETQMGEFSTFIWQDPDARIQALYRWYGFSGGLVVGTRSVTADGFPGAEALSVLVEANPGRP